MDSKKILSTVEPEDFVGRSAETNALLQHAQTDAKRRGLILLGQPNAGASELLKQIYDRLFLEQGDTLPVYFSLKNSDKTASRAALRFAQTFLRQTAAFRRSDARVLDGAFALDEVMETALPNDANWMRRLGEICGGEGQNANQGEQFSNCLSAPFRAANAGVKLFVMIDDLHEAAHFANDVDFVAELQEIFSRANFQFVFAGRRRFLFRLLNAGNALVGSAKKLHLEAFDFPEAGVLIENSARDCKVKINEQTRDLIAVQTKGNAAFIKFLFQAASEKQTDLDNFRRVGQIYADEIFGGRISGFYDSIFERIALDAETQKNFVGLLYDALTVEKEKTPIEAWQARLSLNEASFYRAMRLLNAHEIASVTTNQVEISDENQTLSDYVRARFRLETVGEKRALVFAEHLAEYLKQAPQTMARFYRRSSAIGLRELLSVFNSQETPLALLDYAIFRDKFKGAETADILENLAGEEEKTKLPLTVYAAHAAAFYPAINQVAEKERAAVAVAFENSAYRSEDEIVWIAAEIDSKLEASKEITEFWCDRLEMIALMCNFLRFRLWLVAPEGFSDEALEILRQRDAFGSSKKQIRLLIKFLEAEKIVGEKTNVNEYEMVVPMGEDTELIAAHAVEEIARRHSFESKAINQIKTALVEACINAAEHSHSPDQKIYQKFVVEDDKIVITISNRGLRLSDKKASEISPNEGRRGWGLKLMKTLMDEVKFEEADDGTSISMTKYLKK